MYSPIQIANYLLQKSFDEGVDVTPMKLIKLVYIAHGWYLALYDRPLLTESVQAWKYGPVIKKVYDEFKKYGTEPIDALFIISAPDDEGLGIRVPMVQNEDDQKFLDQVWDEYHKLSAYALSNLTHQKGTPWYQVWNHEDGKNRRGATIPNELIEDHYLEKIDVNRERAEATG